MDKRYQERKEVSNLVVEISSGHDLYAGIVRSISYSGLVIDGVPSEAKLREEIFTLTVRSDGQNYRLRAIPMSVCENNHKKTIRLRIFSVPRNWYKFVDDF